MITRKFRVALLTLAATISLYACGEKVVNNIDDLEFPFVPEQNIRVVATERFAVEWRIVETDTPIYCGAHDPNWYGGCSYYETQQRTCVIFAYDPLTIDWNTERQKHEQFLSYIGHEYLHCVYGDFH